MLLQKFLWVIRIAAWWIAWGCINYNENEIVLAITGGLFVFEAISVIVQVLSYKLTGKEFLKWL